jgi:vesicle coat complex subunit
MDPLKSALVDRDPYVRKTAALCVAKLYDLDPRIAIDNGLLTILSDMLGDSNPMVISNAVAALAEISDNQTDRGIFSIDRSILHKLLAAINECTEWGQICILDSLSKYAPGNANEAQEIVERVVPRLQHANASVVLSAVRVLMIYLPLLGGGEHEKTVVKKLAPPLGMFFFGFI